MTQPVQEPSTDRSLSAARWGNNQLFRRPAPTPAAASASRRPWIVMEGLGWDMANNTDSPIITDTLYWDNTLLNLDPGDPTIDNGDIFVMDTVHDTLNNQDTWVFVNRDEGWFTFELAVQYDEAASRQTATTGTYATAYVFPTANFGGGFNLDRAIPMRVGGDWKTTAQSSQTAWGQTPGLLHLYRTVWCPAQRNWGLRGKHTGGATIAVVGHLKVWHEEDAFGGDPDNNLWEAVGL